MAHNKIKVIKMGNETHEYAGALIKLELGLVDQDVFRDMYCLHCSKEFKDELYTFCPFCATRLTRREKVSKGNLPNLYWELDEMILEEEKLILKSIDYGRSVEVFLISNFIAGTNRGTKYHKHYRVTGENYLLDSFKETEETLKLISEFRKTFAKEIEWLDDRLIKEEGITYQLIYGHLVVSEG